MVVIAEEVLPEQRLRESYVRHAVRTQLHRLCAVIDEGAPAVDGCRIDLRSGGGIDFATAEGAWTGAFLRGDAFLPQLTRLEIGSRSTQRVNGHRARSTVHYFIALVENPARDPEPFRELLDLDFSLGYTPTPISDLAALDAWVKGPLSSVVASEHDIHAIDVRDLGSGRITAQVRMTSQALFPDGSGAISRNTQSWTLNDAVGDRFPRIAEILIARDAVEFFGPAPLYEPRQRP